MEVSTSSSKRTHEAEASGDSPVSRRRRHGSSTDSFPWNAGHGDIDKARPTWEDMIIAYSTIPGYASSQRQWKVVIKLVPQDHRHWAHLKLPCSRSLKV